MKVSIKELKDELLKGASSILKSQNKAQEVYSYAQDKYNLSSIRVSDILFNRIDAKRLNRFEGFIVLDALNQIGCEEISSVDKFFTDQEIEEFSQMKVEPIEVKFPLVFDALQISDEQWISKISVADLMLFRSKQFISYNANTQRQLKKIIKGKGGEYQITLCSGRVADMSDKLYEYAQCADFTNVYVNEKTGRESKLNVDDPTIIKNFCNTYSNSASRTAMNVNIAFNRLKRILQIDNINATQIVDSGRIDYIQRYCKKHDISIDDYIDHGDYTSLENQFGVKFNKYSFRQKYGKFLFGDNNEKNE